MLKLCLHGLTTHVREIYGEGKEKRWWVMSDCGRVAMVVVEETVLALMYADVGARGCS